MVKKCVIFAAAPDSVPQNAAGLINWGDIIISADGGHNAVRSLGLTADYVVADFDSLPYDKAALGSAELIRLPVEKDDTDTMAAARLGLELGCKSFLLLGASGGRLDHTLANIAVMKWLLDKGCGVELVDRYVSMSIYLPGSYKIPARSGAYLSLIPYGGAVSGVSISNVQYPLDNATLAIDSPLGVSNRFLNGSDALLSFSGGTLTVILAHD